jgi:hypothetical protein
MSWEPELANSFEQFIEILKSLMPSTSMDDRSYWFRGQSDATWHLESSFMRSLGESSASRQQAIGLETAALKEFRSKAHFYVSQQLLDKVKTTPCWWALMQHHGAPTRLLDWTISPYVAAYFASHHDGAKKDGAVWCFCSNELQRSFEKGHGKPPSFESDQAPSWYEAKLEELCEEEIVLPLEFTYASSERMAAQQGRFTMCFKIRQRHDCVIEQVGASYVRKIVIPYERKPEFLLRLREMNITGSALFRVSMDLANQ